MNRSWRGSSRRKVQRARTWSPALTQAWVDVPRRRRRRSTPRTGTCSSGSSSRTSTRGRGCPGIRVPISTFIERSASSARTRSTSPAASSSTSATWPRPCSALGHEVSVLGTGRRGHPRCRTTSRARRASHSRPLQRVRGADDLRPGHGGTACPQVAQRPATSTSCTSTAGHPEPGDVVAVDRCRAPSARRSIRRFLRSRGPPRSRTRSCGPDTGEDRRTDRGLRGRPSHARGAPRRRRRGDPQRRLR